MEPRPRDDSSHAVSPTADAPIAVAHQTITLPKGGGALRGIGEKFGTNPVTGTGTMTVPILTSDGRSGFHPQLALSYDSGYGNGPFGLGWNLGLPAITRKTDKGLPLYRDGVDSDVFIMSGAEDLVAVREADSSLFEDVRDGHRIHRYRPRVEGLFARIERWTNLATGETHWRTISPTNITTLYGLTVNSRIADPVDSTRVFSWLICESYDDRGNAVVYVYAAENSEGVELAHPAEKNRTDLGRSANRYIKRIKYGNRVSRLIAPDLSTATWLFEVVFDYDEDHYEELLVAPGTTPTIRAAAAPAGRWKVRPDQFSRYRSAFEVRTYRRCRRVLMFHQFDELGPNPYLVRSTEFRYDDLDYSETPGVDAELAHKGSTRYASRLAAVIQSGYVQEAAAPIVRNGVSFRTYSKKSLPPLEFEYTQAIVEDVLHEAAASTLENLPVGIDGQIYQWVDLDGEGLAGVLTEQGGAWFYKRNQSALPREGALTARFGPLERLTSLPMPAKLSDGQQLIDLAGDGDLDVVLLDDPTPGYFERKYGAWATLRPFASLPNIDWKSPNLRFVDLTGDGLPDLLITGDEVLSWHASLGEQGYAAAEQVHRALDDEKGPRVLFADGTQSIYLADMSGDGLTDIVRISNGEICYWPHLGYGRFGAKVTMANPPRFDRPDHFDQRRIRLADIDGSGVVDVIYLHADGACLYFNQCGNAWSGARALASFPRIDEVSSVAAFDLLGDGTAALVWSSPLPHPAERPLRYVRLMTEKPDLMVKVRNNLGAETTVHYAPSTRFFLQDREAGRPWITNLPFPVHVVERLETFDHISRNRFASRYAYHHGAFDGVEREFRGFALVDQWDSESFEDYVVGVARVEGGQELAPELNQPPVLTRTWFHTGQYVEGSRLLHQLQREYYQQRQLLPDARLPTGLDAEELRESVRALKGFPLRREVYGIDDAANADHPYSVSETTYEIRLIQRRGEGKHAVFLPLTTQSLSLIYERDPSDPRVSHGLNLEYGPHGTLVKSASVVYGRQAIDASLPAEVQASQSRVAITYVENDYTGDIDQTAPTVAYRLRVPYESRSYEITGIKPDGEFFTVSELTAKIAGATGINYEVQGSGLIAQRRLLSQARTYFRDNSLNPMPLGQRDTLGLIFEQYQLAFTPGVAAAFGGSVADADFTSAGYVHLEGDANWWIPSGTVVFPPNPAQHFFIPVGAKDPLGLESVAVFDKYDLLLERAQIKQAPWSDVVATNDYRVLGPVMSTDPNKNRTAVEIDALGLVVKSAVMGKQGLGEGDTLADPTMRMEYELFNWMNNGKPNFIHIFARRQHGAANTGWQESYTYSNGSGGIALIKAQAHPGKALQVAGDGTVSEVDADPRWVGNGRTVLNNKGNPVKKYEPYFSVTHEYEDERAVRELGVTSIRYYDPLGRNVRTLYPDGSLARVEFTPWMQKVLDANDTVKESQWYTDRGSPDPVVEPEPLADPERRAAWLAAKHANTPGTVHFDSLGRTVYAVTYDGGGTTAAARTEIDLTGRFTAVFDQLGREVSHSFVGMAGQAIWADSAEKGRRFSFANVIGAVVRAWDEHGRRFRTEYDVLHRPTSAFVQEGAGAEVLVHHTVYGDRHPNAEQLNLRGATHLVFDQAGQVRVPAFDFKGNPARAERLIARVYDTALNWSSVAAQANYNAIQPAADPALETAEVFTSVATYDALSRPMRVTLPDGTILVPTYNEAGFLASLQGQIHGQGAFIDFLREQDYDAKGQRQFARYSNDLVTEYFYDSNTFRLTHLLTYPAGGDPDGDALQSIHYTYDPVGNITQIRDDAQQTYFFNNAVVRPESRYEYDALYQLIRATGREHAGGVNETIRMHPDVDTVPQLPHVNNAQAVRTYTEEYVYDVVGNITALRHRFINQAGAGTGWTRHYRYVYQDDAANRTNRLARTSAPGDPEAGPYSDTYDYDVYGNITRMPHLAELQWSFADQLRKVDLGGGGTAYYVYGAGGQRLRKVIDRSSTLQLEWIFLGAVMLFRRRRRDTGAVELERWTVHIGDNAGPIAQVDTKTKDVNNADPTNPLNTAVIRHQYLDHLGSAEIETDEDGNVISYEEYHPFGTTAYRSSKAGVNLSLKRYRFTGKERDDESGLYYFGARYYAPWLGRWTSADPAGFAGGFNLFRYCSNNPVMLRDPNGMQARGTVIQPGRYTGEESFEDLVRAAPPGYRVAPGITAQNYREHWMARSRVWALYEPIPPPEPQTAPGAGTTAGSGQNVVQRHPEGHIHEVAENFDDAKVAAYNERVQERAIGIRSRDPGSTSRTNQLRAQNQHLRDDFEAGLQGGQRPAGTDIDHTVELQDISRRNNTVRPQDHRVQNSSLNRSQGSSQMHVNRRNLAAGVPEDVPAGAVARTSEMGSPRIQPAYRTAVRRVGYGLMALGPALTIWGSSQVENEEVRYTGYGLGAVEAAGGATYVTGRFLMGGGAAGSPSGLAVMRVGGGIARVAGGTAGIVLGTYALVTDFQNENYGVMLGDAAGIVAGGAILAGSAPVAAIATGVAVTNVAGDFVESKVTPEYGRTAGVAAGTVAGAATGAVIGAAIGVWFFGVGAPVGAAVGGVVGGIAGFVGAYW